MPVSFFHVPAKPQTEGKKLPMPHPLISMAWDVCCLGCPRLLGMHMLTVLDASMAFSSPCASVVQEAHIGAGGQPGCMTLETLACAGMHGHVGCLASLNIKAGHCS